MAVFGVIDCAALPGLHTHLANEAESRPLFAGIIPPDLLANVPHIVRFAPQSALLAAMSSGDPRFRTLGVICAAPTDLWSLRHALRRYLQAMLPDGRVVLFRFYDPRVLPVWLSTLEGTELALWFDPVTDWLAPGAEGIRHFRMRNGQIEEHLHPAGMSWNRGAIAASHAGEGPLPSGDA